MLPLSRKPEILRLHQLQQSERNRYVSQFRSVGQQWLPNSAWSFLPLIADIYFTYITICKCRRRLGEEYTYVAMYNEKHYEQQGVLVNSKTRTLMFVLQIAQRHLLKLLFRKALVKLEQKVDQGGNWKLLRQIVSLGADGIFEQGRLFMLMLFILGWNKHFNVVDTILKNQYVYTYMNKNNTVVDYRIEGYMLLVVFLVKLIRFFVAAYKSLSQKRKSNHSQKIGQEDKSNQIEGEPEESQLCRICYDQIKNKSVTSCGHTFCWDCILRYLSTHPQCPVCRSQCEPRQIIQLQNY